MSSGLIDRGSNRRDAVYEHPYGGVASNADPADIQPNEFVQGDGFIIKNGKLCCSNWNNISAINYSDGGHIGWWSNIIIRTIFTVGNQLIAVSNIGQTYIYNSATDLFVLDQVLGGSPGFPNLDCFQIIAGVIYFFDFNNGCSYIYTPTVSFVINNLYVGGKYCCVLEGYLITANTNQPTDAPAIKHNRYNWSSPYGYGVWDPAIDRTAGFNTISDAQDEITGLFAMGNVGYILREQGLTQLTPTGIGIQPFDTTPLWESEFGIGCTYPDTFSQYGNLAVWGNDNNIYAFALGAIPQAITGNSKTAIYNDINAHESDDNWVVSLSGCFSNSGDTNKTPELFYTLCIVNSSVTVFNAIFWTYNVNNKTWTRQIVNLVTLMRIITEDNTFLLTPRYNFVKGIKVTAISVGASLLFKRIMNTFILSGLNFSSGIGTNFLIAQYINDDGQPIIGALASGGFVVKFRQEELRLGTQPTVRGVIIKATGQGTAGNATITVDVSGVRFSDIIVNSNNPKVYISTGIYTGQNPQLTLASATLDGYITKANMAITFAEGEPT